MDIGTLSLILLFGMLVLLAIGMPLGLASGFLAAVVLFLKFGPDLLLSNFGSGPLNILAQRMYGLTTDYVLISVPLFIFMATLLERSGIARDMYNSLSIWDEPDTGRDCHRHSHHGGGDGGHVGHHREARWYCWVLSPCRRCCVLATTRTSPSAPFALRVHWGR